MRYNIFKITANNVKIIAKIISKVFKKLSKRCIIFMNDNRGISYGL